MATLSRREKYKELRDQLQHDNTAGETLSTPELTRFSKRLNQIDSANFAAPEEVGTNHDAVHVKKETSLEEIASQIEAEAAREPIFDIDAYRRNENDTSISGNDMMDEVIREVKQYNIENGNAVSQNTSLNIMKEISGLRKPEEETPVQPVSKPYPKEKKQRNDTADIPFMSPFRSYTEDDDEESTEKIGVTEEEPETESSQTMSREDIMAEVQNLVNGKPLKQKKKPVDQSIYDELEDDRTTRQRLLNETTQMRAQLDGYEDNLSEVNDKMRYTNRILNIVLVVLIIALIVILFILIYWVVLSRGA